MQKTMQQAITALTKQSVEKALKEIENEVSRLTISKRALVKFGDTEEDKIFHSFIDMPTAIYFKAAPLTISKLGLKNIVELGNREGVSTLCIWDKLPSDATFTTVDIVKDQRYCPDEMYHDKRVKFVFGDVSDLSIYKNKSDNSNNSKNEIPFDIDYLFSDTIHYNFQISDEFEVYQHLLADTALVAIDDIHLNDKNKFFEKIPYTKWDLTKPYHASGWGLFLYERKEKLSREERLQKAYEASAKIWKRKFEEQTAKLDYVEKFYPKNIIKKVVKSSPAFHKLTIKVRNYFK